MTAEIWFNDFAFYLIAGIVLLSALGVIFARRVMHAALCLLPCLLGVAALYGLLAAHLLVAIQILVYAGAITVLILFAVMMLQRIVRGGLLAGSQHLLAGVVGAGMMSGIIMIAVVLTKFNPLLRPTQASQFAGDNVRLIGELFLTKYLLPFEAISIVLLVAMVGAIILARKEPEE